MVQGPMGLNWNKVRTRTLMKRNLTVAVEQAEEWNKIRKKNKPKKVIGTGFRCVQCGKNKVRKKKGYDRCGTCLKSGPKLLVKINKGETNGK